VTCSVLKKWFSDIALVGVIEPLSPDVTKSRPQRDRRDDSVFYFAGFLTKLYLVAAGLVDDLLSHSDEAVTLLRYTAHCSLIVHVIA
jgi:hypothetical protein